MDRAEQRIMRIPLPVALIRDMDAAILAGVGGYATRAEFILDAIQERILELTVEGEVEAGPPVAPPSSQTEDAESQNEFRTEASTLLTERRPDLSFTAIQS